jgi:hypothetical protein
MNPQGIAWHGAGYRNYDSRIATIFFFFCSERINTFKPFAGSEFRFRLKDLPWGNCNLRSIPAVMFLGQVRP